MNLYSDVFVSGMLNSSYLKKNIIKKTIKYIIKKTVKNNNNKQQH